MTDRFTILVPHVCPACETDQGTDSQMIVTVKNCMARFVCKNCGMNAVLRHEENKTARMNTQQARWATNVRHRDGNRCKVCGSTENLEAHHIVPVAAAPEQRYNEFNGILLCRECHRKAHGR